MEGFFDFHVKRILSTFLSTCRHDVKKQLRIWENTNRFTDTVRIPINGINSIDGQPWIGDNDYDINGDEINFVNKFKHESEDNPDTHPRIMVAGPLIDGDYNVYDGHSHQFPPLSIQNVTEKDLYKKVNILIDQNVNFLKAYEMLTPNQFQALANIAKENNLKADIVVPVPDSGNAAALGFAQHLGMKFELGLIRNHYVGRTFIEPSQKIRSLGVKLKLNANQTTIKDKKIILIDDSLVRGTTSYKIVKMLYDAGAKEVHVKIACPEIRYPDFYGVDTPTKKELLAANKTNDEICEYIGAKSLKFLSLDGLYKAMGFKKRNASFNTTST